MRNFRQQWKMMTVATGVAITSIVLLSGCSLDGITGSDNTAPVMSARAPADGATEVAVNRLITATFNEAMDPASITATSFTVTQGGAAVVGTVTYAGNVATMTPQTNLAVNTLYTVTMTTAAMDLAGNRSLFNSWTFRTRNSSAVGPSPVNLGAAGQYVILAKSAVSTTGVTAVTGDIGLSPAAASYFTGFSQTLDAGNAFSMSSTVTGRMYASDYAAPTPANLTASVLDMQTAYTDAAGRTLPDFAELGAGNIDGMTLAPGLYKWGTGVTIPTGVTLAGGGNDVWIFQISQNLNVGDGAIMTLTGGARPENIVWQVAGQVTLGTTSQSKGVMLCQTMIAMNTGSALNGRALAQTAVTLDATAVTAP